MLFVLIATIVTGLGAAGLVMGLGRLTGRPLPRYAAPIAGGAAMFVFMLWNEYTWYDRSVAALPGGATIAQTVPYSSPIQPWTMVWPRVIRFAAVDPVEGEAPGGSGLVRADVILVARFQDTYRIPHLFDCAGQRRAALPAGGSPADPGGLDWVEPGPDDSLLDAACAGRPTD